MKITKEEAEKILDRAPKNAEFYCGGYYFRFEPEFMFHNGVHDIWNLTLNNGNYFKSNPAWNPIRLIDIMKELNK